MQYILLNIVELCKKSDICVRYNEFYNVAEDNFDIENSTIDVAIADVYPSKHSAAIILRHILYFKPFNNF